VTGPARVFVNGVALELRRGSTALDAVRQWSADAADSVARGTSVITDSRGLPAAPETPIEAGVIFRVIPARGSRASPAPDGEEHL
jgi:hypothetical protein